MKKGGKVEITWIRTSELFTLSESEKRKLLAEAHSGDRTARERLILCNLRLVLSVIRRFSSRNENPDDLFQVGVIGLIKAIDNFKLELDVQLSTYAVPMIIGEIRRYLRDNHPVKVSRSTFDRAYRALSVRDELTRKTGREPTVEEIARALGEDLTAVSQAMEALVDPVSLYESVCGDGEDAVYIIDQLKDDSVSEESWIENIALREAMERLSERERDIIRKRFWGDKTQKQVAAEMGVSQAQVSRIEKRAIKHIQEIM